MAEIFVFCSFRTRPTLVCATAPTDPFSAPHEVAGAAARQWVSNCGVISLINSVGLPVVAMLATPGCRYE